MRLLPVLQRHLCWTGVQTASSAPCRSQSWYSRFCRIRRYRARPHPLAHHPRQPEESPGPRRPRDIPLHPITRQRLEIHRLSSQSRHLRRPPRSPHLQHARRQRSRNPPLHSPSLLNNNRRNVHRRHCVPRPRNTCLRIRTQPPNLSRLRRMADSLRRILSRSLPQSPAINPRPFLGYHPPNTLPLPSHCRCPSLSGPPCRSSQPAQILLGRDGQGRRGHVLGVL